MLHRIREACGRGDFTLTNVVEADETYVGGRESSRHEAKRLKAGRGTVGNAAVAGVRQRGGKVSAQTVDHTNASTLIDFVESRVASGSKVYTDDARAYSGFPNGFNRYVNEATFRFNEGNFKVDTVDRMEHFARGVGGMRLRYTDSVACPRLRLASFTKT